MRIRSEEAIRNGRVVGSHLHAPTEQSDNVVSGSSRVVLMITLRTGRLGSEGSQMSLDFKSSTGEYVLVRFVAFGYPVL